MNVLKVLTLFFTRGVSLEQWVKQGLFDREKLLYEELLASGFCKKIYWLTYGSSDAELANKLIQEGRLRKEISVIPLPKLFDFKIGKLCWSFCAPLVCLEQIKDTDVCKTNQMDGAWTALIASALLKKPFYARTGYTWSLFEKAPGWKGVFRRAVARTCEMLVYRACTLASVSSIYDREVLLSQHQSLTKRLFCLPNYVDQTLFNRTGNEVRQDRIVFVGRLTAQKNLYALINAVNIAGLGLDLVGQGDEENGLKKLASSLGADVRFLGKVANSHLPNLLKQYKYFALVSFYEGMPKALIEAMGCGCLCIGTDVRGINELIQDGTNGILAYDVSENALVAALKRAQTSSLDLGKKAEELIHAEYSLRAVIEKERQLLTLARGLMKNVCE